MRIEGLPEGVEAVRVGAPEPGEYFWDGGIRGPSTGGTAFQVLIVQPAEGFNFTYDVGTDTTVVVEAYQNSKWLLVKFEVTNERDEKIIRAALAKLPGVQLVHDLSYAPAKKRS